MWEGAGELVGRVASVGTGGGLLRVSVSVRVRVRARVRVRVRIRGRVRRMLGFG